MPYQAAVQGWRDFYLVAGGASATLVGLLFVGLALHLRTVVSRADVRSLARVTLTNFTVVLLAALFSVIPQGQEGASQELIISGVVSAIIIAPSVAAAARARTRTLSLFHLVMRFGLSVAGYAGIVAAGALLGAGEIETGLTVLCASSITLLVISLRNSWDLLVSVGAATLEHRPPEAGAGGGGS
ncbi:MAG: hypothetical protein ACREN2_03135 [Candidatus Dormibacteria bacterium]